MAKSGRLICVLTQSCYHYSSLASLLSLLSLNLFVTSSLKYCCMLLVAGSMSAVAIVIAGSKIMLDPD